MTDDHRPVTIAQQCSGVLKCTYYIYNFTHETYGLPIFIADPCPFCWVTFLNGQIEYLYSSFFISKQCWDTLKNTLSGPYNWKRRFVHLHDGKCGFWINHLISIKWFIKNQYWKWEYLIKLIIWCKNISPQNSE